MLEALQTRYALHGGMVLPVQEMCIRDRRYYWLGVIFYFTFQMFSYVNESPMFSTAAYYFFFATIIAVVFFSDSLQNKITIALLFVIMNYACKTAMTGIALDVYKRQGLHRSSKLFPVLSLISLLT